MSGVHRSVALQSICVMTAYKTLRSRQGSASAVLTFCIVGSGQLGTKAQAGAATPRLNRVGDLTAITCRCALAFATPRAVPSKPRPQARRERNSRAAARHGKQPEA